MRNQRGFLTLDFIFSMILIWGFTMLLFAVTMTLTTASIVQYITFASARNYFAAHSDPSVQLQVGEQKYSELVNNPVFKPLVSGGWFEIDSKPNIGDISKVKTEFNPADKNEFYGAGTRFVAKILDFKIAYFGSTDPEGDGSGSGFQTYIGSYLGREPSSSECWAFIQERWKAIRALSVSGGASYSTGTDNQAYKPMEDSGC